MTDRSPLFSISIPTYNRADGYLRQTLESAVAQSHPDLEILVSDNASTDSTEALVRSFDDPRIRYVKHPRNIGHMGNFRFCHEGARGNYVLILHDDDLIDPDFIATCAEAAAGRLDYGIIHTGVRVIDEHGQRLEDLPNHATPGPVGEFILAWFAGKTPWYMCNMVYNRKFLAEVGGVTSKKNLYPDVVADMRLAARYDRLELPDIKASFRRHGLSTGTTARLLDWIDDSLHVLQVAEEVAPDHAEAIREQGEVYFCRTLYRYARRMIASPWERWRMYFAISERFHNGHTPYEYALQSLRAYLGRVKRGMVGARAG